MTEPKSRLYEALTLDDGDLVTAAFWEVAAEFKLREAPAAMDDRAERLVDAITQYLVDSCEVPLYVRTADGWVAACSED